MRRRVIGSVVAIVAILATGFLSTADTTLARYTDVEATPGQLGAATVVLGAASKSPTLAYYNSAASGTVTATLTVVYAGTTPARLTLNAKAATTYASNFCQYNALTGWSTKSLLGLIGPTITFTVAGTSVPYCTLLGGAEYTLAASVDAGSTTTYTIPAAYTGLLNSAFSGKTDSVPLQLHAYSTSGAGFNHTTTGTLTVSTSASGTTSTKTLMAARAATPASSSSVATPTTTAAPTSTPAAAPPTECAGMGPFAETVTLTAANPSFDAARDRPGTAGPFLVLGSAAADTIVGSAGADCLVGGDGDDVVSGGAGDDVLVGGAGVDTLTGGAGADRLYGGAAVDALDGGPGADLLDGGADGARCTTDADDTTTGCLAPTPTPTTDPAPAATTAPSGEVPSGGASSGEAPSGGVPSGGAASEGGPESSVGPAATPVQGAAVPEGGADPTTAPPPT
jgi:hypothetical protein